MGEERRGACHEFSQCVPTSRPLAIIGPWRDRELPAPLTRHPSRRCRAGGASAPDPHSASQAFQMQAASCTSCHSSSWVDQVCTCATTRRMPSGASARLRISASSGWPCRAEGGGEGQVSAVRQTRRLAKSAGSAGTRKCTLRCRPLKAETPCLQTGPPSQAYLAGEHHVIRAQAEDGAQVVLAVACNQRGAASSSGTHLHSSPSYLTLGL